MRGLLLAWMGMKVLRVSVKLVIDQAPVREDGPLRLHPVHRVIKGMKRHERNVRYTCHNSISLKSSMKDPQSIAFSGWNMYDMGELSMMMV